MPGRLDLVTESADETRALGAALARTVIPRDVVSLTGDLGAGKTTLVQGVARGLGVDEPVLSPTFMLVREYEAPTLRIFHLDVYRLERIQDVLDLGFEEILDRRGLVLIEWGDAIDALLPEDYLQVELTLPGGGDERRIAITGSGRSWADRWDRLTELTAKWRGKAR